jgi:hypothetical protein
MGPSRRPCVDLTGQELFVVSGPRKEEFLEKAKEAQRLASYAMIPEVRAEYEALFMHWLDLYEHQMKLELREEALGLQAPSRPQGSSSSSKKG